MRTAKEIKDEIREVRREMKSQGIKKTSCFNGGLSRSELSYNTRLFKLSVELERAEASAA